MRRSELLEKQIRRASENERVGSSNGISSEEVYQYLTDGVRFIQRKIIGVPSPAYRKTLEWSASGIESQDLPFDIFTTSSLVQLSYSHSGQPEHYRTLERVTEKERLTHTGRPSRYMLEGRKIIVSLYPTTGTFRATYDRALPAVDKRRATVSGSTVANGVLLDLTLAGYTAADYALSDYLTVVDFYGTIKMRGIPYTAVNSGTGVVSLLGGTYTFPEGSEVANGDYVCLGEYATTHPQIDDALEDFMVTYGTRRLLKRDSSADATDIAEELRDMWFDHVQLYAQDNDVSPIPTLNGDFFGEFY